MQNAAGRHLTILHNHTIIRRISISLSFKETVNIIPNRNVRLTTKWHPYRVVLGRARPSRWWCPPVWPKGMGSEFRVSEGPVRDRGRTGEAMAGPSRPARVGWASRAKAGLAGIRASTRQRHRPGQHGMSVIVVNIYRPSYRPSRYHASFTIASHFYVVAVPVWSGLSFFIL